MRKTLLQTALALACIAFAPLAAAHAVWLERSAQGTHLYFGEYDEGLRESSPGRLDDIGTPRTFNGPTVLAGEKVGNEWRYPKLGKTAELRAEALESAVRDWRKQGIGIVKPLFFARYAERPLALQPVAELDLVPGGKPGVFQLFAKGQPLSGVKVAVVAPNGWMREIKTDKDGKIELKLPWRGLYVLEATYIVPDSAGTYEGTAYEALRMRTTLAYRYLNGPATFTPTSTQSMQ